MIFLNKPYSAHLTYFIIETRAGLSNYNGAKKQFAKYYYYHLLYGMATKVVTTLLQPTS